MKNWLTRLLCALLALSCIPFALADVEFTLRNGIEFGDTMETILTKETTLERESEDSNWFNGRIAGYDNATCGFYFDDDGKLDGMDYKFGEEVCTSRDTMNDVYKKLYQSLVRQYGTPLGNTSGSCYLITGPAVTQMALWVYFVVPLAEGSAGDYVDYDEWVVEADGYNVKIDIVSYYFRDSDYEYSYYVDLSYQYFTDADLEEAVNEKQSEQEEVDNDL